MSTERVQEIIAFAKHRGGPVLALTGAGISAESGIPTFRGSEGYWKVGSTNYHPQELATYDAFCRMPEELWAWYLHRRSMCQSAEPNAAHHALARLEQALGDDFVLITQNVDGLHRRAGSSRERTYEIHGNLDSCRCSHGCAGILPLPKPFSADWHPGRRLTEAQSRVLRCTSCSAWLRPHVLWFDECYDEPLFRFESSLRKASAASLLLIVGTTGSTNLPLLVASAGARNGAGFIVVNPEPNPFTEMAEALPNAVYLPGTASGESASSVAKIAERIASVFAT